mmetsp:Transcript_7365/g.20458  ORF Transcript_7365/g.20458 Transcript_7365/m.20458 type:complete len:95 (-) Transcript_7365:1712-1996(-)
MTRMTNGQVPGCYRYCCCYRRYRLSLDEHQCATTWRECQRCGISASRAVNRVKTVSVVMGKKQQQQRFRVPRTMRAYTKIKRQQLPALLTNLSP